MKFSFCESSDAHEIEVAALRERPEVAVDQDDGDAARAQSLRDHAVAAAGVAVGRGVLRDKNTPLIPMERHRAM